MVCGVQKAARRYKKERMNSMKKRTRLFTALIVAIIMVMFAVPVFAVTVTNHGDSYSATSANAYMSPNACCSGAKINRSVIVRGTYTPVLNPSSTAFVYGNENSLNSTSTYTISSNASVPNSNYKMIGAAHYCGAKCGNCGSYTSGYRAPGYSASSYTYH